MNSKFEYACNQKFAASMLSKMAPVKYTSVFWSFVNDWFLIAAMRCLENPCHVTGSFRSHAGSVQQGRRIQTRITENLKLIYERVMVADRRQDEIVYTIKEAIKINPQDRVCMRGQIYWRKDRHTHTLEAKTC